jgi:spermidine synthase
VFEGNSELSGDYVIEEIIINNIDIYRRLLFLNSKNIIQSEAKLKTSKKGKKTVFSVDHKYLSCSHHQIITSGLTLINNQDINDSNLLLIGLGGGCLPTYLLNNIQTKINLNIKVIEIDKSMMNIAIQWFELKTSNNSNNVKIEVEIEDGLKYISSRNPRIESYDFIVFDVDSKEINVGMSCPPLPFVETEFLEKVNSLLKERNGVFVLNLVARNQDIKKDVYNQIKSVFNSYFVVDIKQELNEIIFAFSTDVRPNWFNDRDITNKMNSISKHCFYIPLLKDRYIDLSNSQLKAL